MTGPSTSHNAWILAIQCAVSQVSDETLVAAARAIFGTAMTITAGNGGSSAMASHMAQAIAKPGRGPEACRPAVCLTDRVPVLTAHANDGGWDNALVESARPFLDAFASCCVIIFSSSGKSENVIRLAQLARERHQPVIAFTGFDGRPLRQLATVSLHVSSDDYEIVEPAHDALLHRVQQHLRQCM